MPPAFASVRRARPLLGTFVEISATEAPGVDLDVAIAAAFQAVADVHRLMSPEEAEGDVGRLNREASSRAVVVHPWTHAVLRLAIELKGTSAGAFDVAAATHRPGEEALELLPRRRVRFARHGVRIDLGGIAKGFAVDRAVECLRRHGVSHGLVNAGGDLVAFGGEAQVVHVRDPRDPRLVLCAVDVRDEALASSGGRYDPFEGLVVGATEVTDPSRHAPVSAIRGATVRASSCMLADALTKIVMVRGPSSAALLARYGARAMFVSDDGDIHATPGWAKATFGRPEAVSVAS